MQGPIDIIGSANFVNTVDMQSALSVAAVIANGGAYVNNGLYINGTELANDNGTLTWNGSALGSGGGFSVDYIEQSTNLGIGSSTFPALTIHKIQITLHLGITCPPL